VPLTHLIPLAANLPGSVVGWVGLIVMFSVAVAIHELGHLLWTKRFGVGCEEFAIGFGRRLIWREWGGTVYSVRALPLGGFVKIKGMIAALEEEEAEKRHREETETSGKAQEFVRSAVYESSLAMKDLALWKRLLVFGGGVVNNVVLAILCFVAVAMIFGLYSTVVPPVIGWVSPGSSAAKAGFERGDHVLAVSGQSVEAYRGFEGLIGASRKPALVKLRRGEEIVALTWSGLPREYEDWLLQLQDTTPPLIAGIAPNSPAERAGLEREDLILAVNGVETPHWMDLQPILAAADGEPVDLLIRRGEQESSVTLTPEFKHYVTDQGRWTIGFIPGYPLGDREPQDILDSLQFAFDTTIRITVASYTFIFEALTFQLSFEEVSDNLGGPVMIFVLGYKHSTGGLEDFLWFAGVLNLILAIMNILPIPILDGGHCLINIIEGVRRRPIPLRVLERVYTVFFILIVGLMLTLVAKDIVANLWRVTG
jgi:regulator of sigma E protease